MPATPLTYHHLEATFLRWAATQPALRAAVVVGLRARVDQPADEWSDLDVILFITEPHQYAARCCLTHRAGL